MAGDLHQAEFAERQDGVACFVALHFFAHDIEQLFAVFGFLHVDEVNNDDATHVAQPQLAGYLLGRLDVYLQGGVFLSLPGLDVVAAVDINDMHGFGVLDIEIDARADGDNASKSTADVACHPELLEMGVSIL